MNFWNNPEYAAARVIVVISILSAFGYFAMNFSGSSSNTQAAMIVAATSDNSVLGSGVTVETVTELNKEVERLNKVRTSDAWYVFESRKKRAEESLTETLNVRSEVISSLATDGKTVDRTDIALAEDLVELLPESTQRVIETPVAITGELYTEHVDDFENPENSYFRYFILTEKEKRYDILSFDKVITPRAKVKIEGQLIGSTIIGSPEVVEKRSHYHSGAKIENDTLATPIPGIDEEVTNRVAVFLVKYLDSEEQPFSREEAQEIFFNSNINNFFKEQSYNKMSLGGDVFDWYTFDYESNNEECYINMYSEIDEVVASIDEIDILNYDHIIVYNDCYDDAGSDGYSTVGDSVLYINDEMYEGSYAQLRFKDNDALEEKLPSQPFEWREIDYITSHELGHSLGLQHSHASVCEKLVSFPGPGCTFDEYGNYYSSLGYGWNSQHFAGIEKDQLGWIDDDKRMIIDKSGTYSLGNLINGKESYYAQIKVPGYEFPLFSLERRISYGFDSKLSDPDLVSNQKGLFISKVYREFSWDDTFQDLENILFDMSPHPSEEEEASFVDFKKVTLDNDRIFTDPFTGIKIGPILSFNHEKIVFEVHIPEGISCVHRKPVAWNQGFTYSLSSYFEGFAFYLINADSPICEGHNDEIEYTIDISSFSNYEELILGSDTVFTNQQEYIYDLEDSFGNDINFSDYEIDVLPGTYPVVLNLTNTDTGIGGSQTIYIQVVE